MANYANKANVIADQVEMYIAARTTDSTAVTLPLLSVINAGGDSTWKPGGTYGKGKLKIVGKPLNTPLHDGTLKHHGVEITLDVPFAETDDTKIGVIEGFLDKTVDILLRVVGKADYHRLQRVSISYGADFPFSQTDPNKIPVTATVSPEKLSDVYDKGTLATS